MKPDTATLVIVVSHLPFSRSQEIFRPLIEIDRVVHRGRWGENQFVVSAGPHALKTYHRWFFFRQAFASTFSIHVSPGQTIRLRWQTGWFVKSRGRWTLEASEHASAEQADQADGTEGVR